MLSDSLPAWVHKLPGHVQLFIVGFVAIHVVVIAYLVAVHFSTKKSPDFKAKIK